MKQLKTLRIFAILGIITVFVLFGTAMAIFLMTLLNIIHVHIAVGIVLLVWSIPGMYVGLFTAIWVIVSVNKTRIIKPLLKGARRICWFSLNPFVILAGRKATPVAKLLIEEHGASVIDPRAMREKLYKMMKVENGKLDD